VTERPFVITVGDTCKDKPRPCEVSDSELFAPATNHGVAQDATTKRYEEASTSAKKQLLIGVCYI
jgi:hypothetical protein